jgi:hypothetical protein
MPWRRCSAAGQPVALLDGAQAQAGAQHGIACDPDLACVAHAHAGALCAVEALQQAVLLRRQALDAQAVQGCRLIRR